MGYPRLALAILGVLLSSAPAHAEAPTVVVTIKPIHSLVAGVMAGVGSPELLIKGAQDEHTYALRPSEARLLARADLVVWVAPSLEAFMVRPLDTIAVKARKLELMTVPGLIRLPVREGGTWEPHHREAGMDHEAAEQGAEAHQEDEHREDEHGTFNAHIWLDPINAQVIVQAVATALSRLDPGNAAAYGANAEKTVHRLKELDQALQGKLAVVQDRPFVVFHDAYQYFESRYNLNAVGSVTAGPQTPPSAKRIQEIRAKINQLDAACVFSEPQFEPKLVDTLIEGTNARRGSLDAIGAALAPGPESYFILLDQLADNLRTCLHSSS
jgi:zinc transport system substrate-binding protein